MWIHLPAVKRKQGEALQYRFQGKIKDHFDSSAGDESTFDLDLSVRGGDEEIMVRGRLRAEVEVDCSRCLMPFVQQLDLQFDELFSVTAPGDKKSSPEKLALETANQLTISGDYLYLDEYIRQLFVLGQVYNPLCKPDCRGLCPGCGADLNETTCSCEDESGIDLRWQKLKELRPDK